MHSALEPGECKTTEAAQLAGCSTATILQNREELQTRVVEVRNLKVIVYSKEKCIAFGSRLGERKPKAKASPAHSDAAQLAAEIAKWRYVADVAKELGTTSREIIERIRDGEYEGCPPAFSDDGK